MGIDIADTESEQRMLFDEMQDFVICSDGGLWQHTQAIKNKVALSKIDQRELTNDEGVHQDLSGLKQLHKGMVIRPQMIDPNRGVNQYHFRPIRRRRATARSRSLPPRRASRRAASRSINAFKASRTRTDFSFRPVNSWAFASNSSSSANVVRIQLSITASHLASIDVEFNA